MPNKVEDALGRVASKYAKQGKLKRKKGDSLEQAKDRFLYGTMTNLQKRGSIAPWRKLKK